MSSPACYRQKRRRPIIAKVGGISSCLALLATTLLSAPYNTATPILPIDYNIDESIIERRNEGYSGLRNRRSLTSDSWQISNFRVSHHNNNRQLQIDSTCIRITTGTSSYNDGYLSVYINNGSGYTQVSSGYHSKGDMVLDTCYDGLVTVQIEGIDNNAWIGSIESSISNNEYYPMICADCAGRSDNTQNIVVDGDGGNGNYPNSAKCLNGDRCTLIADTQTNDTIEVESSSGNECKDGPDHLHPGDALLRGEFLCHGNLRFGIDFDRGQFMVGFVNGTDISSTAFDDEEIPWGGNYSSIAMPDTLAWRATPTTLFIPDDRPFSQIILKEHGNILGYDDDMVEIYDSNYDYRNRIDYKAENSFLRFSDNCKDVNNIDVEEGEMCIKLVSPPTAGWPVGMTTWGVVIDPNDIVNIEPMVPTTAPVPPTLSPTVTSQPSSASRGDTSSSPTSDAPNAFDSTASSTSESVEINYESSSIIWGTVWLDSNRNGVMDLGEQPLNNMTVELHECGFYTETSEDGDENDDGDDDSRLAVTDEEGAYFLQVPTGRTYRVKFHIDDEHGYSRGTDTDTNMMGWTSCETSRYVYPIQWNAGLYRIADMDLDIPEAGARPTTLLAEGAPPTEEKASIGGHVYLDVDENGQMDNKERTAAVGGYTVRDATVAVTLTDCKTDEVIDTTNVEFPGTYSFGNLTEGFYKLGYEMEVMLRSTSTGYSGYSFIGSDSDTPTFYETPCGKLGDKEVIDSGNVGLRPLRSSELDEPSIGETPSLVELERSAVDGSTDEGNPWLIPVIVTVLITLAVVAVAAALLIKRMRGNNGGFPVSIGSPKSSGGDVHSVGSNDGWDTSMISAPSADQQGIQGTPTRTHVAQMSAAEEADESESDSDLEISRPGSSSLNMISSSEGYEVYDDEDQPADYGPVVSNIIAQYHQKDQNEQLTTEQEAQQSPQHQEQQESQAYPAYQYQTQQHGDSAVTNDYEDEASTGSSFTAESSDPPAASYRDIPSSGPSIGWDMGAHQQQQYNSTSGQYVSNDSQYYDASQYDSTANNYGDYQDPQDQHHPSDSSSSSSEELGDSGWTSVSSSTAASLSNNNSNFNWSYGSAATTQQPKGQRSSSNPRDNRQVASWRQHQSAIPENSTWREYNNNTAPSNNVVTSGFTSTQTDDSKSVLSTGSDQSADPPGASYKNVQQFPPPPRRSPTTSPNRARGYPPPPPRSYSTPRER